MANNNNEGVDNNPDNSRNAGSDKSFVGKFMSGIINSTPLSKWFGTDSTARSVIRRRDEEEEFDASFNFQPPSKRAKLPTDIERNNYSAHVFESPVTVHASNNVNSVPSKVFGTFPEPVPGPSGIKSRKLFPKQHTSSTNTISTESFENQLDIVNGDRDSDSGDSTSGYSSAPKLISKEKSEDASNTKETCEKIQPKNRSLFTQSNDSGSGRTLFGERSPQMNTSLSSRRPTFNASTFGSPNFVDRTLSTKRIMSSPFYSGRTMYGGASAYGRKLGGNIEDINSTRNSVQIKPVNEKPASENATLSKTARRILSTLEQYSTPISDAKKIPITPRKSGLLSSYVGATPYLVRDRKKPSHQELQVPSIPDLLQMKQKERLQNSTETVRQIASKSKSDLNKEEYKLRTEEDEKQKHSNKMKSSVSSLRRKTQVIEPVSEVKLPKVALPIPTLPTFDFVMMPPSNSSETVKDKSELNKSPVVAKSSVSTIIKSSVNVDKKETETKTTEKTSNFTFSEPLVISKDLKSVTGINCFKFSEPLNKKPTADTSLTFKSSDYNLKSGAFKLKNNGENTNFTEITKPASQLLTGSVMDILGKNKEKPLSQSLKTNTSKWECPTCLVRNDDSKTKCSACDEPKPQTESDKCENKEFGDQFKLSTDKWECSSCLVRNNNSDVKCVACTSAKPNNDKPIVSSGFGDKFKPPASTWECNSCLIRNQDALTSCAACGTPKVVKNPVSNSFGDKFKPASDTWECSTCMIRNKKEVEKCEACETPKPDAKPASVQKLTGFNTTGTNFSFGIKSEWECKTCMIKNKNELEKCAACETPRDSGDVSNTGFGDRFKMKSDEWKCTSCMVTNKANVTVCVCCGVTKPGNTSEKLAEISKNDKKPVNSFNFGIDKASAAQFKFGIPTTNEAKETNAISTPPTFSFGSTTKPVASTASTFSFGINTQEKIASSKTVTSTSELANVSTNPLLKPNEKLPEKVSPAPVGFKFGLDNSSNKKQNSETVVSSSSKTETSSAATFSSNFGSTSAPTFQFKPTAVNGDINKTNDNKFGSDTNKSNTFGTDTNKSKDNIFGADSSKLKESPFNRLGSTTASFGSTSKSVSQFGASSKASVPVFAATNKSIDSPFGVTSKPPESPFSSTPKSTELPFGAGVNKTTDSPFGTTTKPTESPFGSAAKSRESPFRTISKPTDSPFATSNKPSETPFGATTKPIDSPFGAHTGDSNKPKESLFGTPNETSKPQSSLFGNVAQNNDVNKPKEVLFGSKPSEGSNIFAVPNTTPTFNFASKPIENSNTTFPSAASQPAVAGIFKFGSDPSQNSAKRSVEESSESNVNGFGSGPKIAAFGPAPSFGMPENKPFPFGSTEVPKSSGFSFGQTDNKPTAGPVFNFGSSAPSVPSGGFNFTANTGFNFGGAPKVENQGFNAPSTNVFSATGSGAKNGSFNFGPNANNNNEKAMFSFGANQTSQPSQPSFPTQTQAGFNFGAPAPPMAGPPGTFNFSGAPPSFNFADGSGTQTQPQRKIKKALRRTTTNR